MGGMMSGNLLHLFALDRINFNSVGNRNNNVLHDLGALADRASYFFGMRERKSRRVPHTSALAARPALPAAGHVVHLEEQYSSTTSGVLAVGRLDARPDAGVRVPRRDVSTLLREGANVQTDASLSSS